MLDSPVIAPTTRGSHTQAYAYPVVCLLVAKIFGILVWVLTPTSWYQPTGQPDVVRDLLHRYIMLVAWELNLAAIGAFFVVCWGLIALLIRLRPRWSTRRIAWTATGLTITVAAILFFAFGNSLG